MNKPNSTALMVSVQIELESQTEHGQPSPNGVNNGNQEEEPPSLPQLRKWAQLAFKRGYQTKLNPDQMSKTISSGFGATDSIVSMEMTVRIVDQIEMAALNKAFRGQEKPTNVLAFEFGDVNYFEGLPLHFFGDLVICHQVVLTEAQAQSKQLNDHYAHLVTHGVLHLCGYDHKTDIQAQTMEQQERLILAELGIADPYAPNCAA